MQNYIVRALVHTRRESWLGEEKPSEQERTESTAMQ